MSFRDAIAKIILPLAKRAFAKGPFGGDLRNRENYFSTFPPGHFYSPIPSIDEIERDEQRIFDGDDPLAGLDLNEEEQLDHLRIFEDLYREMPFGPEKTRDLRYYFENGNFSYSDGIFLYCMLRKIRPGNIIEVGSGYSTCVMLDTNERFLDNKIRLTCIEPYPQLLESLLREGDGNNFTIIPKRLQDVPLDLFRGLKEGDILFIDSTHVSKIGSDVNHILFRILPVLQKGVYIHFHDIYYPFEYPKWVIYHYKIVWNEAYLLRAFLQFNASFKIVFFGTFLEKKHEKFFHDAMPLCLKNPGGSIWLRKEA